MSATAGGGRDDVSIDPQNPWLGLFSYSEENRAYFHGRDEEAAELARRVQRKLLTILFGQSGLGKTSLLRAGLVPRLRAEAYCPVYVRIDYAPESPEPSEQIKQAIFRATAAAGYWTRPGAAIEGESLWEFLHHRGDLLRDADGRTLLPLLIFDQFEEIFTLGQADDTGRVRAKRFLDDLADLVENRPPASLEERLEDDENAAEDFDFARADYRILIALREDYLAHLESLKGMMPSITQNRMRLARMTGTQALSAVVKPGGKLVSQEVAEAIVRFVAGGSELANAEIEPSLLSLVCRELNTMRIAQGREEISAALLAGSRDTILSEFYERALADQPAGVRRVIEDDLLTESGYRESLAEERVIKALVAEGASPDALATLVNRRLLRIEERLDVRRVELTHDVLCGVVLASRNLRHEREARDEAERELAAQREREEAQHRALVRARLVATVCAVLMVIAAASAVFGFVGLHRAREADAAAQKAREMAEHARGDAEKLVAFLIDDFYTELEPTGRLDTLGRLAHTAVSYYDGLPKEMVTPQTEAFRAMALTREGAALNARGEIEAAYKLFGEAQAAFEKLRASGHDSETVTYGLALTLFNEGQSAMNLGRGTKAQLEQAADLLRPAVQNGTASRQARQTYADTLNILSHLVPAEQGVAMCEEARKVLAALGATDLSNLYAASAYADTGDSEARHLASLGRLDEAQKLEQDVYDVTEKVLQQRPGDLRALADRFYATGLLSDLANRRYDSKAAADYAERAARAGEDYVRFNPADLQTWSWWVAGLGMVADQQYDRGEIQNYVATVQHILSLADDPRRPSSLGPIMWYRPLFLAFVQADLGDKAAAEKSLKLYARQRDEMLATLAPEDPRHDLFSSSSQTVRAGMELLEGDPQAALADANAAVAQIEKVKVKPDSTAARARDSWLRPSLRTATRAAIRLGHSAEAESLARRLAALPRDPTNTATDPRLDTSSATAMLAHAVAMQGRVEEARRILEPALAYYREAQKDGAHDTDFRKDFAYALYVEAIASDGARRSADLAEAQKILDGATLEAQRMESYREVASLIRDARAP
jgi:Novel STAND NTPase 1